jgi:hypothetical protein
LSDRKCAPLFRLFICLLAIFTVISLSSPAAFSQNEAKVLKRVRCVIDIYGHGPTEFVNISGPCDLVYTDPYLGPGNHIMIDTEHYPGELLINYEPMHLTSIIDQFPPYFSSYVYPGAPILLYDEGGIEVAAILEWEEQIYPYYPPEAHITCPMAYKSEVAILNEVGLIEFSASLNGIDDADIEYAEFSYRPFGSLEPFTPFYTDFSGEGTRASTINPRGTGDGWCGYFEPGSEPFEDQVVECRVGFSAPEHGFFWDTVHVYVDPTPPIPTFTGHELDSIGLFEVDSFFDITYELDDEMTAPGLAELQAFPLTQSFARPLTTIDQLGLGTDLDEASCGPTSAASCLKYFADNGYPALDNPGGVESKPNQSGEEIARELQGAMGTDSTGTSDDEIVAGIKKYLADHKAATGWEVSSHTVDNDTDLAAMFRELEADSEDVLVCLEDTSTSGGGKIDTAGHWVTLGSREQIQHSADSTSQKIDFMDPWEGGSTADNKYDVGKDGNGKPTTEGYNLDGAGNARIVGYIKVSPPKSGGGGGSRSRRAPGSPSFDPGWIPIDAGMVTGNGVEDTLHWDTSGFVPGLYLLEVITTDDQGFTCRDLRMCLLIEPTTGSDPGTPGIKTGLHGTYPNPFNPATTIVYSIERDGPVTMAIYDIAGRRIRSLMDGKMTEAGRHTITWDGFDNNGRQVSSGVYFCRFTSGDTDSSSKMILLR